MDSMIIEDDPSSQTLFKSFLKNKSCDLVPAYSPDACVNPEDYRYSTDPNVTALSRSRSSQIS